MMRLGTLPLRKPGTWIWLPMVLYAASRLGLSSSYGTSTVSFTRVGLRVSTALFTAGSPGTSVVVVGHGAGPMCVVGRRRPGGRRARDRQRRAPWVMVARAR